MLIAVDIGQRVNDSHVILQFRFIKRKIIPSQGARRSMMLVLTRSQNESIIINDDFKITIFGTKGQDVKIGIEAPEDVEIWREEIYDKLHEGD